MQIKTLSFHQHGGVTALRSGALLAAGAASLLLSGCGMQSALTSPAGPVSVSNVQLQGKVYGGQQPVSGSALQLYVAGSGGYGSASYALLAAPTTTDSTGSFSITGNYTCPTPSSQAYIVATGGNSGNGNNPNLAMMAALGACSGLSSATFIQINEVTTVASVWALAPFMSGAANVGASSTNAAGLASAFAAVNKLATIASGLAPGSALPAGATAPTSEINTLADILAACINTTGGVATDTSTVCGKLFANTTVAGGAAPTDTVTAALNIARNPGLNVTALYNLAGSTAPFQPTLTAAPSDWTISIKYTAGGFNAPSASAVDSAGNVWVTNGGGNSVTLLSSAGTPALASPFSLGAGTSPSAVAIDVAGNAWITNKGNNTISRFSSSFTPLTSVSGGGLNAPAGISFDASGNAWVVNSGNNSVSAFNASGTALSPAGGYTGGGLSNPVGIAINPR